VSTTVPATLWTNSAACKPLDDLKAAQRLVAGACGFAVDTIIFGKDCGDYFENAASVLQAYDKQHIAPGQLTPEMAEFGVTLLGQYRGTPLFVSEAQYTDLDSTKKYYVPADCVLLAASGVQGTLSYAGIVQVDENEESMQALEGTRIPLVWYEKGEDYRKVRLSSHPAPIPAAGTTSWTLLKPI
jgi:Phage major capsid protein E